MPACSGLIDESSVESAYRGELTDFATQYLRNNGSIVHLQRILGHADIKTTQIYLHLVTNDLVEEHHRVSPAQPWLAATSSL